MEHTALLYHSDAEMVATVAPYLADALASGAPAIAVLREDNWAMVREALGPAADQVAYTNCDAFYSRPIDALEAYDGALGRAADRGSPPASVVGELPRKLAERDWREWTGYEALLNHSLARYNASVLCTYDMGAISERLAGAACRTHPRLIGSEAGDNTCPYEEPADVLRSLAVTPTEIPPLPVIEPWDVIAFRDLLEEALDAASVEPTRGLEMQLAATEVFVNASRYGGGATSVRAGTVDGVFVCEISDAGPGLDDPLAGYLPPGAAGEPRARRSGLWTARTMCSRVELIPASPGLTVRLWL
ncbi:MAG: hypothetical protein QOH13_666 [Thermoleophilaceae bacterium]|nr:hypothetical protein [Thermoleophilaceae bacterium]